MITQDNSAVAGVVDTLAAPVAICTAVTSLRASAALPASKDWWTSDAIPCAGARFVIFEGLLDVNAASNQIAWMVQGTLDPVGTASPVWVTVNIRDQANGTTAADVIPGSATSQPVRNAVVGAGEVRGAVYATTGNNIPVVLGPPSDNTPAWDITAFQQVRISVRQEDGGTAPDLAVRYALAV